MTDADIPNMLAEAASMAHESMHIHRNAGWVDITRRLAQTVQRLQMELKSAREHEKELEAHVLELEVLAREAPPRAKPKRPKWPLLDSAD